ncbi:hypothetical protein ACFWFZ_30415 [Streptomyces sp. NPDC060232]|uniref:hypothetical protein n=1 Tax=Streptomyces sp. NPDC060232 TaxID=3347079 RepID=UPI0036623DB2
MLAALDWSLIEAGRLPTRRAGERLWLVNRAALDHYRQGGTAPGQRETVAGLRRQVDGSADGGHGLRSAIAARFADQEAAQLDA